MEGLKELRRFYEANAQDHAAPPPELLARARVTPDVLTPITSGFQRQNKIFQERIKTSMARESSLRIALLATIAIGLIGGLFAALMFPRGLLRRVRQLEHGVSQVEHGMAPEALFNVEDKDEIGKLAVALEKARAILAAQDHGLRLAMENARLLIWELEPETHRLRYQAGSAALQNSSLPEELLPETVAEWIAVIHVDDREMVRSQLSRAVSGAEELSLEYRVVLRGGEVRWMLIKAHRRLVETGKPERLLGVLADITDRRNAEAEIESQALQLAESKKALEQQTRILRSVLDSMGDGVVVADPEGNFIVFNPAAQQILGPQSFQPEAARWTEHFGCYRSDGTTLFRNEDLPLVRAMAGESVDAIEMFVRPLGAADGIWISINARPLRHDDGAIRGGVAVMRDITSAKNNADALESAKHEAESANQAKSEFLSRMSHELRTPLNSILGFAQLLELAELQADDRDNVQHILKGGYHLLDLINEILDLARIESGRLSLSPEPVRMREALRDALDLVRPLAQQQNINLSPDIAIRCDRHVHADRQRLKQVLLNLLSNAIKFNRPGGSVVLSCEETAANTLRIEVSDSGSGISQEGLKKIFTPFERLNADQTEVGGTGLGLALSKRLIEAMGGTIGVESAVGLGSRFSIELMLLEDPVEWLEKNPDMNELAEQESDSRGLVLYIEDNTSNLRLIERIMGHCPGVRLITAMQGQLGIELAAMHLPNWILLDLHLPDIGGEEVLRRLRANPRTANIPVTVLSADATRSQITRLLSAGARDYLTKPVDVKELMRLLEATLDQNSAGDVAPEGQGNYAERSHSK